jgi:hypothetical protein
MKAGAALDCQTFSDELNLVEDIVASCGQYILKNCGNRLKMLPDAKYRLVVGP